MYPDKTHVWRELGLFLGCCVVGFVVGSAILIVWAADQVRPDPNYRHVRRGKASWYAASGMVCASRFYTTGTWLKVTYRKASIVVQVTSAGPAWRFVRRPWWKRRVVDLSRSAFLWLEKAEIGMIDVEVEPCAPPISTSAP